MFKAVKTLAGVAFVAGLLGFPSAGRAAVTAAGAVADFRGEAASADAREAAARIVRTGDNHRLPFAIVDKKAARLFVFDGASRLAGASEVLIGLARGDAAAPGPAPRTLAALRPADRMTPAGRFLSEPGHNDRGEAIVWVDYGASLAIHRLRPAPASEHRPARLASPFPEDRRISLGCIVAPVAFYETVVAPVLGRSRGVVYVLPESRAVDTLFASPEQLALR